MARKKGRRRTPSRGRLPKKPAKRKPGKKKTPKKRKPPRKKVPKRRKPRKFEVSLPRPPLPGREPPGRTRLRKQPGERTQIDIFPEDLPPPGETIEEACPDIPVTVKTWEKPKCPRGYRLARRDGHHFLWVVDEEDRKELWFDTIYGPTGYILEEIQDLQSDLAFFPEWISILRHLRSSEFAFTYNILVEVFPTQQQRLVGGPSFFEFECEFILVRPFWRYDLHRESVDHLVATIQWLLQWIQTKWGGYPPHYFFYLTRYQVDQTLFTCLKKPVPRVPKPPKPPVKPPKPRVRKQTFTWIDVYGKKRKSTVYRDPKGRFVRSPVPKKKKPVRKRRK